MKVEARHYAGLMLAAGAGIPIVAGPNASLGVRLGSPVAVVLFAVALAASDAVRALTGGQGALRAVPGQPGVLFSDGLVVAF